MVEIHEIETYPRLRACADRYLPSAPGQCSEAFFKHDATDQIEHNVCSPPVGQLSRPGPEISGLKINPIVDWDKTGWRYVRRLPDGANHTSPYLVRNPRGGAAYGAGSA